MPPKRALFRRQKLPLKLLPPQPRPLILRRHILQKRSRQVRTIRTRRSRRLHRRPLRQNLLQQRIIARRRRHHLPRVLPQPQRKLQHIPRLAPLLPLRQLIHPSPVKLRPPQPLGVKRRIKLRHRPVRPNQPLPRCLINRTPIRRRTRQNSTLPKNHNLTTLLNRLAHQRNPAAKPLIQRPRSLNLCANPFSSGAGLPRATPAQNHPGRPLTIRRQLVPRQSP